jgi:hypothetical protein
MIYDLDNFNYQRMLSSVIDIIIIDDNNYVPDCCQEPYLDIAE